MAVESICVTRQSVNTTLMDGRTKFFDEFSKICDKYGDQICMYYVYDLNTTFSVTYFELDRISSELKEYFSKYIGNESRYVAVEFTEYFYLPCVILAIWKNKNSFVGIGTQYTPENTLTFLETLGVNFLITDKDNSLFRKGYSLISTFHIHQQKFFLCQKNMKTTIDNQENWNICYGIMTSGSTGLPKVIQVPWSCILLNIQELMEELHIIPSDCIFLSSPCTFDPFFVELFLVLINGCSIMIVLNVIKLCLSDLLQCLFCANNCDTLSKAPKVNCSAMKDYFDMCGHYVCRKPITALQMTPSVFTRWSKNDIKEKILSANTSLKYLILGGEKFPVEIMQLKHCDNKTKIFNIYGITEISCWAFINEINDPYWKESIDLGKPLKYIVYKLNDQMELILGSSQRVCIVNNEKEVCYGDKFVWRSTGDVMKLINNKLYYSSRCNSIIKKFGMKINLEKIEKEFLISNSSMSSCVCVFEDVHKKLALFYILKNSLSCSEFTFRSYESFTTSGCYYPKEKLKDIERPDFFIEIQKLPLNTHGKCDRSILLKYLKKIDVTVINTELKINFQKIWNDVLGLGVTGLNSKSFIELGGNSVLALQLINKLQDIGLEVPTNFITMLLNEGSQEECLKCLKSVNTTGCPQKKLKVDVEKVANETIMMSFRWKFNLEKCIDATPCCFNYLSDNRVIVGSHSSKLSCIASDTGQAFWTVTLGDRIESGVAVTKDGSRGFVGCYDRFAYCLSMTDGSVCWKFETGDMIKSTPCLSTDEKVLFVASYDKCLYFLLVENGSPLRRMKISDKGIYCTGIINEKLDTFFLGTLDGSCVAVCQSTYELKWKKKCKSPIFASPCLIPEDQVVFIEVVGLIQCFNAVDGSKIWKYSANSIVYSTPLSFSLGETTNLIFGCNHNYVHCLKVTDKIELNWKQEVDSSVFARICLVDIGSHEMMVCAATTKGNIYLCNLRSGQVQTTFKLAGDVFSSPICVGRKIFVGCRDNYLYALDVINFDVEGSLPSIHNKSHSEEEKDG